MPPYPYSEAGLGYSRGRKKVAAFLWILFFFTDFDLDIRMYSEGLQREEGEAAAPSRFPNI